MKGQEWVGLVNMNSGKAYLEDHQETSGKYSGKMKCDTDLSKPMA